MRCQSPALAVFENNNLTHPIGQTSQGGCESQHLLVPNHVTAGRRLIGRQPGREPGRGAIELGLDRSLQVKVPLIALIMLHRIGQGACQNAPQPGHQNLGLLRTELSQRGIRPQHRLLNDIRRIELTAQAAIQMRLGQHLQVPAVLLQFIACAVCHPIPLAPRVKDDVGSTTDHENLVFSIPFSKAQSEPYNLANFSVQMTDPERRLARSDHYPSLKT